MVVKLLKIELVCAAGTIDDAELYNGMLSTETER